MKQSFAAFALVAVMAATLMMGCAGFEPMHATAGGKTTFSDIDLVISDGRDEGDREAGYLIRQHLADRIDIAERPTYRLVIDPRVRRIGLGLTAEDFASRFDSRVSASWRLLNASDGAVIDRGSVVRAATYSADPDPYQLLSATDEAVERAAREVADRLLVDVALAISDRATTP